MGGAGGGTQVSPAPRTLVLPELSLLPLFFRARLPEPERVGVNHSQVYINQAGGGSGGPAVTEIVWDATGDKHLFPFILVLPVNLFTAVQTAGSQRSPTPSGCGSREPGLRLPSGTGSASPAPAAGQVSGARR